MEPLYKPGVAPCAILRYAWTGWPALRTTFPAEMESLLSSPSEAWEDDGLRLLERRFAPAEVQMTFSVKPQVAPIFFSGRTKGRLDHALRRAGVHVDFSRKIAMRTVGENHRAEVEAYIEGQAEKEPLADSRVKELLKEFTVVNPAVDLSQATETNSGRYWYNLHLVLTTESRWRNCDRRWLEKIRDLSFRIAEKKGYGISRLSAMSDHAHLSLRGNLNDSPEAIALAFQNNLAYCLGQVRVWQATYYAGTFGEYDMNAVRTWDASR
jgi:REP element-mobilizing transposase RayT